MWVFFYSDASGLIDCVCVCFFGCFPWSRLTFEQFACIRRNDVQRWTCVISVCVRIGGRWRYNVRGAGLAL